MHQIQKKTQTNKQTNDLCYEIAPDNMSVNAPANPIVRMQTGLASFLRPGQWLPGVRNPHRANDQKWNFKIKNSIDCQQSLNKAIENAGLWAQPSLKTDHGFTMQGYSTTKAGFIFILFFVFCFFF